MWFCPTIILVGLLLWPWMWGISSKSLQSDTATAPKLHSHHGSAYNLSGSSLPLDVGCLLIVTAEPCRHCPSAAQPPLHTALTMWIKTNCGKFFKRWEYQTTLPVSWEICIQVKKQQLELDMEQQTSSISGKEYVKAVYCHCLFNLYAEYIMWNARLDEAQAGIKIAGRIINNLRYADDTILMQKAKNWRASWKWKRRVKKLA